MKKSLWMMTVIGFILAISATSGLCWNSQSHVSLAADGKGDLIIFPVYVATPANNGGWKTKITITNTDEFRRCVVRIGFHTKKVTQEVRDFNIYLSPADVWTATIDVDPATGKVRLVSDDDSCVTNVVGGVPTFASTAAPYRTTFDDAACAGDTNQFGYITAMQFWSDYVVAGPGATKLSVYQAHAALIAAPGGQLGKGNPREATNIITGAFEVWSEASGMYASQRATVLKDFDMAAIHDVTLPLSIHQAATLSNNSIGELEAALSKTNIAMKYYNSDAKKTMHFFTLPTKVTNNAGLAANCNTCTMGSPFFLQSGLFERVPATSCALRYFLSGYDLTEKPDLVQEGFESPTRRLVNKFPDEVNWTAPYANPEDNWLTNFREGWANYHFVDATNVVVTRPQIQGAAGLTLLRYTDGAPIIPLEVSWTNNGLTITEPAYSFKYWVQLGLDWKHLVEYNTTGAGFVEQPLYQIINPSDDADGRGLVNPVAP